jgi:hypothetical protein
VKIVIQQARVGDIIIIIFILINGYETNVYDTWNGKSLSCGSDRSVIELQLWHLQMCNLEQVP